MKNSLKNHKKSPNHNKNIFLKITLKNKNKIITSLPLHSFHGSKELILLVLVGFRIHDNACQFVTNQTSSICTNVSKNASNPSLW